MRNSMILAIICAYISFASLVGVFGLEPFGIVNGFLAFHSALWAFFAAQALENLDVRSREDPKYLHESQISETPDEDPRDD